MEGFEGVAWLPLCAGLTVVGCILSWVAWRRRGAGAGLRGIAWSLLPVAAYLTGAVELLWQLGSGTVRWVSRFAFSPTVWAGVIVAGLSLLLFVVSGALRRRGRGARADGSGQGTVTPSGRRELPTRGKPAGDDELSEVEEILRRRGIS